MYADPAGVIGLPGAYTEEIVPGNSLGPHKMKHGQVFRKWKADGVPTGDIRASEMLNIDVPSPRNVNRRIEQLEKEIADNRKTPAYQLVENAGPDDFVTPGQRRKWKITNTIVNCSKEEENYLKGILEDKLFVFGSAMAASGFKGKPSKTTSTQNPDSLTFTVNWAIIKPRGAQRDQTSSLGCTRLYDFQFGAIPSERILYKVGSATGISKGVYGGLECNVVTMMGIGQDEKKITWEHIIVARRAWDIVVAARDAGSLVFDSTGSVVASKKPPG
ncbi:hypothetical protein BJX76DRAFT_355249 [Aspergillus varians]